MRQRRATALRSARIERKRETVYSQNSEKVEKTSRLTRRERRGLGGAWVGMGAVASNTARHARLSAPADGYAVLVRLQLCARVCQGSGVEEGEEGGSGGAAVVRSREGEKSKVRQ